MSVITQKQEQPLSAEQAQAQPRFRVCALLGWLASPLNLFAALVSVLPLLFLVLYVAERGVNTPLMDQWENNVLIAIKTANGTLSLADLFRQNFDHRLFFSNLVTAILTVTSNWNLKVEMMVIVANGVVNVIMLALLFREHQPKALALVLLPFAALMLSLRQNSIWLWSMLISTPIMITFLLMGLYALKKMPVGWKAVGMAAFFATCMSFSLLQGFLGWPLLMAGMWLMGYRKPKHYAAFIGIAVVVILLYVTNYEFGLLGANEEGNSAGFVKDPIRIILYTIAYLGNPFVPTDNAFPGIASVLAVLGLVLLALNAVYLWRKTGDIRTVGSWLIVAAFGIGSGVFTALGRGHVYPEVIPHQPLLDRYVTQPSMLWVAFFALAMMVIWRTLREGDQSRAALILTRLNLLMFVPLIGFYLYANSNVILRRPLVTPVQSECMVNFPGTRNLGCLDYLYLKQSSLADVTERIDQLSIYQLADFGNRAPLFSSITSLHRVPRNVVSQGGTNGFRLYEFRQEPTYETIVFMQQAPGQTEFTVELPQTNESIYLVTAVYVDRSTLSDTSQPQDGVLFRVGIRRADGIADPLHEVVFDPNTNDWFKPITLSLDAYKGETVNIILQTDPRDNPNYDGAMWIDPVVITRPG